MLRFRLTRQGDLVFMLGLQSYTRGDLAEKIYAGNMLDRAAPIRSMIGALALARALDYRATYDAYEKLNDAARASLSFDTFTAVKTYERDIVKKAQELAGSLTTHAATLQRDLNDTEAAAGNRQAITLVLSLLGTFALLVANLVPR